MSKRWLKSASLMLVGAFLAAACSQGGGTGGGKGEIIIASDFPVSGADRASGRPAEAGTAYAIQTNNTIKGFTITHKPYDDAVNGVQLVRDSQRVAPAEHVAHNLCARRRSCY